MKPMARHKARCLALQAIYQWQLNHVGVFELEGQFLHKLNSKKVDIAYFHALVQGVLANIIQLDETITPFLDRPFKSLDEVELAVLRLATYELSKHLDVPHKVIINEALELTKSYGSLDGYKYINGVLDKVAHTLRSISPSHPLHVIPRLDREIQEIDH